MGTWSAASFGNDDALDWLGDLVDEQDPDFVMNTLEIVADFPGFEPPEAWDCCCALAAAEMVAAARGAPPAEFPDGAKRWLAATELCVDEELLSIARKAISKVLSQSRLKDLWDESEYKGQWYQEMESLQQRLG